MAENKFTDGKSKSRSVLSDITKRAEKRGNSERNINSVSLSNFKDDDKAKRPRTCLEINALKENAISGMSKVYNQNIDPNVAGIFKSSANESMLLGENDKIKKFNLNGVKFHSQYANQSIDTENRMELEDSNCDGKKCDTAELNMNLLVDDLNANNLMLSQSGSIELQFPPSQESRVLEVDASTKSKEVECTNTNTEEGNDSIGACSCSFCIKAVHMWLELQHKDVKSRISALKKGQRDATVLAERSCTKHEVPELENDMMHMCTSLFKFMSKTWEDEGNQLQATLQQLNYLREKCNADLERFKAEQSKRP